MSSLKVRKSTITESGADIDRNTPHLSIGLPDIVVGRLLGRDPTGALLVDYLENPHSGPLRALATAACADADVGRDVALLFVNGDPMQPLIVGVIRWPERRFKDVSEPATPPENDRRVTRIDGERLVLTAEREIVIECGATSITLTRAGKLLMRSAYLSSRSSGVNRIKGASVQIN